ncbi:MAG: MFS transporter [Myxococcales bacterium]|nr:MFS transporter [Myxococcales bacterium]
MSHAAGAPQPRIHPSAYMALILPFGATGGFVGVSLAYLATKNGLSVEQGALLVSASMFPNVWKFLWAPIADITLTRKRWYAIACTLCAIGMTGMATIPLGPSTLTLLMGVIAITSFAATFLGFAVEGLLAHLTTPEDRGRYSGWFQAGNLGGNGIGGGIGLTLLTRFPDQPWVAGIVLGVLTILCCVPLLFMPDVPAEAADSVGGTVKKVAGDLWGMLKSPAGMLCGVVSFVPVGTGAAQSVLTQAEVAAYWGATEVHVAWVQGFLTGFLAMGGCFMGGWMASRLSTRTAYVVSGLMLGVVAVIMAVTPAVPLTYVVLNLMYSTVTGICYATWTGLVLETIGAGAAATKYNGFASLSNTPIWYMGLLLAVAQGRFGTRGMLITEAVMAVIGLSIFGLVSMAVRRYGPPEQPAPAVA